MAVDRRRVRILKEGSPGGGPVLLWMQRDQRASDNWALLYAREIALELGRPLGVVFCLAPGFLGATLRQYDFMLRGLREVEEVLAKKGIPFFLLAGSPGREVPRFARKQDAALLVTDFNPLRIKLRWEAEAAGRLGVPFHQVDAHNIVPAWAASQRREYAAYTLRPKLRRLLPEFLVSFPPLRRHPHRFGGKLKANDWEGAAASLKVDSSVKPVTWLRPGERAARMTLRKFIKKRLPRYAERNDPLSGAQSDLSPYLHFGQVSAQRCALEVMDSGAAKEPVEEFLEELIVRRELSDNFCLHCEGYDSIEAAPDWARKTLEKHRGDRRRYVYGRGEFERGETHDPLWNASQGEMVKRGKMHGYLRMYWAKKILEWSATPEEAFGTAVYLNDKYQLDGWDPNGYAGIAWSLGGVHDRAWNERPVFGKIRYMSYEGLRRKFDVQKYIDWVDPL
ncbi:MAG: deoxyribodipyrimidine photo-lyase [Nitrospirota bacterium]